MVDIFSDKTKTIPSDSEWPNTATDMRIAYEWEIGDSEPKGTHVQMNLPLRRYREDMKKGKQDAARYKHSYILVDVFQPIGPQLAELKR